MRLFKATVVVSMLCASASALAEDLTLGCGEPFGPGATEASLIAAFGRDAVETKDLNGVEGEVFRGTLIHGDDPARRIEVAWFDENALTRPSAITVFDDESRWRLAGAGLGIGDDLDAVLAANGGPFAMSGFGWDYGGMVTDWMGGKLAAENFGCNVSIRFTQTESPQANEDSITGDQTVSSDNEALRAARPRILMLTIGYPFE